MFLKEFVTFNENDLAHKMKVILNSNQPIFLPIKNTTETCCIKTDLFWLHVFHNQNSAIYRNIFYFTTGLKIYMLFLNFLVSFATIMTFLMLSWQKFVWSSIVCYWGQCYMLQWIAQPEKRLPIQMLPKWYHIACIRTYFILIKQIHMARKVIFSILWLIAGDYTYFQFNLMARVHIRKE